VHVPAGDVQCLVMLADRLFVRAFQEAIDLTAGVVVKLNLPHAELVRSAVTRSLGYLVDGFLRQLQVLVKSMNLGMWSLPITSGRNCAPAAGTLSIPGVIAPAPRHRVLPRPIAVTTLIPQRPHMPK
jgi:hypothetical protein